MASITRYPHVVENIEGNTIPYRNFDDADNIKNGSGSVGHWGSSAPGAGYNNAIAGQNGSRNHPSTIKCSEFVYLGDGVPSSRITKITVQYSYRKQAYAAYISSSAHGSFGNPIISIPSLGLQAEGTAPPRNEFGEYEVVFSNLNLTAIDFNNPNFAVLFDLPPNANNNPCYIEMKYLRVKVDYLSSNYIPSIELDRNLLRYGEEATLKCRITESNNVVGSDLVSGKIEIPGGIGVVNAPAEFDVNTGIWRTVSSNNRAELNLRIKLLTPELSGNFQFKLTENKTSRSASTNLTVKPISIEVIDFYLDGGEMEVSTASKRNITYLSIGILNDAETEVKLNLDLGGLKVEGTISGLNLNNNTLTCNTYYKETDPNNMYVGHSIYEVQIPVYAEVDGIYQITLSCDDLVGVYSKTITIHPPVNSDEYYGLLKLSEFALSNMDNGERYVFGCLCRTTGINRILEGSKNLRASITNNNEIFTNKLSQAGNWELLTCEFTYNASKPVFMKFYGNYVDYDLGTVEFGNLFLISKECYSGYEYPVLSLKPQGYLLGDYDNSANLLLEPPEKGISTRHYFHDFDWQGLDDSDVLIHGIEISGEVSSEQSANILLGFGHYGIDEREYYMDSVNVNENTTRFKLGGKFETFGLNFPDINSLLNNFRFYLQIDDVYDEKTPFNINMKNIIISLYYSINQQGDWEFLIDGVSSKYFLISLDPETELPRGANYDTNTYEIEGADGEYPTRVNIRDKKIKLKFQIFDNDFITVTELLKYIVEYLYPKRDSLDNPILKSISFFFDPENCYDYYIEDEMDAEAINCGYDCEVELIVPSGLSRSIEPISKSYVGDISHMGKVKPVVIFTKETGDNLSAIQIIEKYTGQIVKLTGEFITNLPNGTKMKLDCQNRKLYYEQYETWLNIDLNCITLDSTFFTLTGRFSFEDSVNCSISEVIFNEQSG